MAEVKKPVRTFRDLIAWQLAHELALEIYGATAAFPDDERFGLTSQLRRAAVSIPSNIAEGYGRGSRVDYVRFLKLARGSVYEVDAQLQLAHDLGFLGMAGHQQAKSKLNDAERVLAALIRSLETSSSDPGS